MPVIKQTPKADKFNTALELPFSLRIEDFKLAMQDVYDFLYDVNKHLVGRSLERLDDMLRKANLSGTLSDMLTASLAKHSRGMVPNTYHNGHPDLIVKGHYPNNSVKAGEMGVEIKTTRKAGGAVDTHGARDQWMCVFVYDVDNETEPAIDRRPLTFTEIYLGEVKVADFRRNDRTSKISTNTATLDKEGVAGLRKSWVYLDVPPPKPRAAPVKKTATKKVAAKKD